MQVIFKLYLADPRIFSCICPTNSNDLKERKKEREREERKGETEREREEGRKGKRGAGKEERKVGGRKAGRKINLWGKWVRQLEKE